MGNNWGATKYKWCWTDVKKCTHSQYSYWSRKYWQTCPFPAAPKPFNKNRPKAAGRVGKKASHLEAGAAGEGVNGAQKQESRKTEHSQRQSSILDIDAQEGSESERRVGNGEEVDQKEESGLRLVENALQTVRSSGKVENDDFVAQKLKS